MDPITIVAIAIGAGLAAGIFMWVRASRQRAKHHEQVWERTKKAGGAAPVSLHPRIDEHKCICTGACVEVCPEKDVMGMVDGRPKLINPSACIGHGECMRACPVDAITLVLGSEKRGVDIPLVDVGFQTNVPGMYIAGELGGMGLIHNAINQGQQAVAAIGKSDPPKRSGVLQLLVVGAGPAGLGAALKAKELGLDFAVVEQEQFGGALRSFPRQKIVMTAPAHFPLYGRVKLTRTTKEALLELWQQVVEKTGVAIEEGVKVVDVQRGADGVFTVATSKGDRRAQRVLLAIGRRGSPRKLGVPGEALPKVTYKLLDPEQYQGARCMVVGGGDSAVEIALALAREPGTTVTLCHRGDAFDRIKPDNRSALDEAREAKRLEVLLRTVPKEIREAEVVLPEKVLPNDFVFVCIGGELPTAWLSKIGIAVKTLRGEAHPAMAST